MAFAADPWRGTLACALLLAGCAVATLGVHAPASALVRTEAPVTIELRPNISTSAAQVKLGDIAFLTTQDLPTLRRLMALPLGAAPRRGSPALLDRETIEQWIRARAGLFAIRWLGPVEIEVSGEAQHLPGQALVDAAQATLTRWLAERSIRAEVRPISTARDLILPTGATTLRVRPLASQGMPSRRMLVWVDAWVDDRFVRTTAVSFEVGAWAPVQVAVADVERGAPVDSIVQYGALAMREVDLTAVPHGKPVAAGAEKNGKSATTAAAQRLRRALRSGEVLTELHLEQAVAVARGDWAELLARSGEVSIQSRVEVLQDGRAGEVVRVKVPGATGEVFARVTGPGQVEIQP